PAWLCAAVSDLVVYVLFFFFSSRRRHTRFSRDWSSDVCSSDLFATAFNGDVRLCVSHEFAQELKRSSVAQADDPILQFAESLPRSEERRVGRECRSRRGRGQQQQKKRATLASGRPSSTEADARC